MISRETVIIIELHDLPVSIQDTIGRAYVVTRGFIEYKSAMSPREDETWDDTLKESTFRDFYDDQRQKGAYRLSFENFLIDRRLTLDWWLKDQPLEFAAIRRIFIHV